MKRTGSAPSIAFDDEGMGDTALLCLPGWCVDRTAFAQMVALCSRSRRTLALDWRGHGQSDSASGDFDASALIEDAEAVMRASGVRRVVPVALAHAGWVAIELRRRLQSRVPAIVLVDWLVLDPPPPFLGALAALQDQASWQATRDQLFSMWLHGVEDPKIISLVRDVMGAYDAPMWQRAGREIAAAYQRDGSPLSALAALETPVPVLHLYAQPDDAGYLQAQQAFAAAHAWFEVRKLKARSHFPTAEVPADVAGAIESFISRVVRA